MTATILIELGMPGQHEGCLVALSEIAAVEDYGRQILVTLRNGRQLWSNLPYAEAMAAIEGALNDAAGIDS